MTRKQYENLGRAVVAEARLEVMREKMDPLADTVQRGLASIIGKDAAAEWVRNHYGRSFAVWHNAQDFMQAVREIADKKEEENQQ